jgi:uncharacterized protein (DUF1684 family)
MSSDHRLVHVTLWLVAVASLAACRSDAPPAISDPATWRAALDAERAQNDAEMRTSPLSPLAAVERHILTAAAPTYIDVGDSVRLAAAKSDASALVFHPPGAGETAWRWEPLHSGVIATGRDAATAAAPGPLTSPVQIRLGRFTLLAQPVEATFVVSVYDAQAAPLRGFTGVVHFAPDASYAVNASIERIADGKPITMPTTIGLEKTFVPRATLRFTIGGVAQQLTAYRPPGASKALFVPFRDATTGKATYGAGRYLDLEEPEGDRVVVDFNRAYSPLCSYSPAFNCPIPPRENHLTVAIEAGEKTYPH